MAYTSYTNIEYPQNISYNTIFAKNITATQILPFRVRYTNIVLDSAGYSPTNPAPIGIAIVGFNNYIL